MSAFGRLIQLAVVLSLFVVVFYIAKSYNYGANKPLTMVGTIFGSVFAVVAAIGLGFLIYAYFGVKLLKKTLTNINGR
jgi:hypothetical protein